MPAVLRLIALAPFSVSFLLLVVYVFFPLSFRYLLSIYLVPATLQIADNPISVGSLLSYDIGLHCQAVILSLIPRVYIYTRVCVHVCVYEISMLRDINQRNEIFQRRRDDLWNGRSCIVGIFGAKNYRRLLIYRANL